MKQTTAAIKIQRLTKKVRAIYGGQGAGKTYAIMQILISTAICRDNLFILVLGSQLTKLRNRAMKDAKKICSEYHTLCKVNDTKIIFKSGSVIEFKGLDSPYAGQSVRSDICFFNEITEVKDWDSFHNYASRTGIVFFDFNPRKRFFYKQIQEFYNGRIEELKLTWKDNEFLPEEEKRDIMRYKELGENSEEGSYNRFMYDVYYLGDFSLSSGKAFELEDFDIVEEVPEKFDYFISYSDPSLGLGNDYFASLFCGIKNGVVWATDVIFSQYTKTGGYIEKLNEWDNVSNNFCDHYSETNGISGVVTRGVDELYDGVLNKVNNSDKKDADIFFYSSFAKKIKFKRSQKMIEFLKQCADFPNDEHDDAPDCLCRMSKILLNNYGIK